MHDGYRHAASWGAVVAPGFVFVAVLLFRSRPAVRTVPSASAAPVNMWVVGRRAPAAHGVVELQFRGTAGGSARVYWEGGDGTATTFPATVEVPCGQVCVNAYKRGQGNFHEDVELSAAAPKKTLLITLQASHPPSAAELGFTPDRSGPQGGHQQKFLESDFGNGDWTHPEPATPMVIDVLGQVWRGEARVGRIAPAMLAEMVARGEAAAQSPMSPEYVGCIDCGGHQLTLYRFAGDGGTPLARAGGSVSHRTSPEAQRLIEWSWAVLSLAWESEPPRQNDLPRERK